MPFYGMQFTIPFFIVQSSDHITGAAGITWTTSDSRISKDGAAFALTTNTVTALQSGWYALTVTSVEAQANFQGISIVPSGTRYDPQNLLIRLDPAPQSFYAWPQSLYQDAPERSLAAAIGMLTNKTEVTSALAAAGSMHVAVYKANDSTLWFKMTLVQSAGFLPITALDPS